MRVPGLLRSLWLVVLVTALAVATAWIYTLNTPSRYSADGRYVIGPASNITEPETIIRSFDSLQGQGIVPTLVELLSSETVEARVGNRLGLDRRALEDYDVSASVLSSSNTLELAVSGPDPQVTGDLARGIGTEAARVFEGLYSVYEIEPLDLPTPPDEPSSPSLPRNLLLATLLGLTAGTGLALLRSRSRQPSHLGESRGPSWPGGGSIDEPVAPSTGDRRRAGRSAPGLEPAPSTSAPAGRSSG